MRVRTILALTDLSPAARAGLRLADAFAARTEAQVVVGFAQTDLDALEGLARRDAENARRLEEWVREQDALKLRAETRDLVAPLRLRGVETVAARNAREGVMALVTRIRPDLVCMATHGRGGVVHALLGSVAEHTIRAAGLPVAVTRGPALPPPGEPLTALVALDLAEDPEPIARAAAELFGPQDRLVLGHVVESYFFSPADYGIDFAFPQPDTEKLAGAARARLEAVRFVPPAPKVEVRVVAGRAGEGILALAAEAGAHLVVARTHGRRGFDRLMLGSVCERIVRRSPVPVLVIPKA
jgi:nucleotide-binding universal stress UspA family protein